MPEHLTHLDENGRARMVDVGDKAVTRREAIARCGIRMKPATLELILKGKIAKGEVLAVARIAGIMAAKRTSEIIPMCHPLAIEVAGIDLRAGKRGVLEIEATVCVSGKTGVAIIAFLVSWAIAHFIMKDKDVNLKTYVIVAGVLTGLGFLLTFPPFFELFA